jgi:hypothetical protein
VAVLLEHRWGASEAANNRKKKHAGYMGWAVVLRLSQPGFEKSIGWVVVFFCR